jgi:hypothetical protein
MAAADTPQTDRELLLQIASEIKHLNSKIVGKGGICETQHDLECRVAALENWRWYIIGGASLLTFVLATFGRYLDLGGNV